MQISCKCGHCADFEDFTKTLTGNLPLGQFQCPKCGRAWRLVQDQAAHISKYGFYYPPTVKIEGAQAQI
ncbi:hypothetical protein C1H71_20240 (plasmid) [Iodobacter fluviatilis]|uniref:Uncharacterized protein n=1 Tax=Iodobacter fluviatilis TaxID=537 RepID=A0A7G3GG14_9NEIS|nr:hypothetical protein C1H71_20240 [Iodobacter fluviatilis]